MFAIKPLRVLPAGRFCANVIAPLGSDCAHWLPTLLMALRLVFPSGNCCTQASAPVKSLPAHCEKMELIAVCLSFPFARPLAQAIAAWGFFAAQLEASAWSAWERS